MHFNDCLFIGRATGKYCPFPYKSVRNDSLVVRGIPDALQLLRPFSSYGKESGANFAFIRNRNVCISVIGVQLKQAITNLWSCKL